MFIVDTKSLLLQTTLPTLPGYFYPQYFAVFERQALLQTPNLTPPSNLGNVGSRSGSKLSGLGLSFITVNQQSANLNNLFALNFFF